MLIYKDVRGALQTDGTYAAPDGIVDKDNDQVRLSNRSNPYGLTTNLSAEWKGISVSAQISASWGGYSFVPSSALKLVIWLVQDQIATQIWNIPVCLLFGILIICMFTMI